MSRVFRYLVLAACRLRADVAQPCGEAVEETKSHLFVTFPLHFKKGFETLALKGVRLEMGWLRKQDVGKQLQ